MLPARLGVVFLVAAALLPVSCRTYGGYGSEEARLEQIEAAYEAFERDLAQARNDLRAVERVQANDERFSAVAAELRATIEWHEQMLADQEERVREAQQNAGSYRFLQRTLGGMLALQDLVYMRYGSIAESVQGVSDTSALPGRPMAGARYHVVPPYYERLANASNRRAAGTLSWVLQDAAGGTTAVDTTAVDDDDAAASSDDASPGGATGDSPVPNADGDGSSL